MKTKAFITGITGQDGSYLSELLIKQGYEVHGLVRKKSAASRAQLECIHQKLGVLGQQLFLHEGDLNDAENLREKLNEILPDEIYHLAGQSHVGLSFKIPEITCELTAMATLRLLEIIRSLPKPIKLFHATSSEMYGEPPCAPQDENTPFLPVTPYGCAKVFASQMVRIYRRTHGIFACNGIMFNHESPRRGEDFVTQKICRAAAAIRLGLQQELRLGITTARRDWGDARDYVRGMWLMLQYGQPEDFVLATGQLHSVQDVVEIAFSAAGLNWEKYVFQDSQLIRPGEPCKLVGNPEKAKKLLGWEPANTFKNLITEMTANQIKSLSSQK